MQTDASISNYFSEADPDRTAVIGLGNPDRADDGFGITVSRALSKAYPGSVFCELDCGVESTVAALLEEGRVQRCLFIDAADFGGAPGEMRVFGPETASRLAPAFSTHKVPLTFLMDIISGRGGHAALLAVQPGSLRLFEEMTPPVSASAEYLVHTLRTFFEHSMR